MKTLGGGARQGFGEGRLPAARAPGHDDDRCHARPRVEAGGVSCDLERNRLVSSSSRLATQGEQGCEQSTPPTPPVPTRHSPAPETAAAVTARRRLRPFRDTAQRPIPSDGVRFTGGPVDRTSAVAERPSRRLAARGRSASPIHLERGSVVTALAHAKPAREITARWPSGGEAHNLQASAQESGPPC